MLAAPPVEGVREEEEEGGGRESRALLLPSTEAVEPPPFHADSKEEEPGLYRLMPWPSWLRLAEARPDREEDGSDRRPGERQGARSEP